MRHHTRFTFAVYAALLMGCGDSALPQSDGDGPHVTFVDSYSADNRFITADLGWQELGGVQDDRGVSDAAPIVPDSGPLSDVPRSDAPRGAPDAGMTHDSRAGRDSRTLPPDVTACPAPHDGWWCKDRSLLNPENGVTYRVRYRWNLPQSKNIRATALWVAGGNGTMPSTLIAEALPIQRKLAQVDAIRSIDIDFMDPGTPGVAHTGGYWKGLDGYRAAAKIYDVAVRRLIADKLTAGTYLTHVGGSNGTNMAAFALAYHGADSYLDQVVFNAGPIPIDLVDECGDAQSPAHIDAGGKAKGDQIALLADRWNGWSTERYCQRRVAPPAGAAKYVSSLSPGAKRHFPQLSVHTIIGMQDGFGLWFLRSNRKWFDGIRAKHASLECYQHLGHEMHWDRTYALVAQGPQQGGRGISPVCEKMPAPSTSAGIKGHFEGLENIDGTPHLVGWACFDRYYNAIGVHVYAGGPAGTGTFFKGARADQLTEAAVNTACNTSTTPHRFAIPVSPADVATHGGKSLHVHGLAPTAGYPNSVIGSSKTHLLPSYEITGALGTPTAPGGNATITGWACASGYHRSIDVHLYLGGPAGSGSFVAGTSANRASEAAVSTACRTSGVSHRFSFTLEAAQRAAHGGKKIFVYGISPLGPNNNSALDASGTFNVP